MAFQEIRDASIKKRKGERLPLVFFDEFDSSFNGEPLGWLKTFLAHAGQVLWRTAEGEASLTCCFCLCRGDEHFLQNFISQDQNLFRKAKGPDFVQPFERISEYSRTQPNLQRG